MVEQWTTSNFVFVRFRFFCSHRREMSQSLPPSSTVKPNAKTPTNTWCDHCNFQLLIECRKCKQVVEERKEKRRFAFCKCDNMAGLSRLDDCKENNLENYLITGDDTDATLVKIKRISCVKGCATRNEMIIYTLYQWQDLRQQFRSPPDAKTN